MREGEEEGEKLESFFCTAHEFLTDYAKFSDPPVTDVTVPAVIPVNAFVVNAFVPVALPTRFIPVGLFLRHPNLVLQHASCRTARGLQYSGPVITLRFQYGQQIQ